MGTTARTMLALLLAALGLVLVGLAADVFAHSWGDVDTPPSLIRVYAVFIALPGVLLLVLAWRARRPPG